MADQGAEGVLSPWLRNQRFSAALPYLYGRVLDYGCGSGLLAQHVSPDNYLGVEPDEASLKKARSVFPMHRFVSKVPENERGFDSIVSLAVIEHVANASEFLRLLTSFSSDKKDSRIIITTPSPIFEWAHDIGAAIGLFSKHANEEHEELLDRQKLERAGTEASLNLVVYRRFLFGANQIAVFEKAND